MRSVLRRLLWLGPMLVLITMMTFGALSLALPAPGEQSRLPLFFNPDPGAVERLAAHALREVAGDGPGRAGAEAELHRLGGAALPFILPALDSQSPEGRGRVVKALRPVGARMGLEIDERWQPSREVLFWTRFWEEHSIDYRPIVARRAVLRLAQRSTLLRDAEVRQLDTYALDELIAQLAPVLEAADVDKVRRLSGLALEMTAQATDPRPRPLQAEAGLAEARSVATSWSDWWSRNRTSYKTYRGTERVTAMLRETHYGGWVTQAARRKLGLLEDGRTAWDVLAEGATVSLPLLGCGVAGALAVAILGGAVTSSAKRSLRWLRALALLRAALPCVVIAILLSVWWGDAARQTWIGALLMLLAGAPLSLFSRGARLEAASADFIRTLTSLGVARWRIRLSALRLSSAAMVVQLGAQSSSLITLTFVVEYALGLPGLGTRTIEALREPDFNWLMAITISSALFVGLLQVTSELVLGILDPRWQETSSRLGGAA